MTKSISKYKNWQGTAAELASVASEVSQELGLDKDDITPNERLIRHYVQLGILDRPTRKGKEAYFGFTQLVQFLGSRILAKDGWPLSKIADYFQTADIQELIDLVPKKNSLNEAQNLVERFKRESSQSAKPRSKKPPIAQSISNLKDRVSYSDALHSLGNPADQPERKVMTQIELTPWCHVYVDSKIIKTMDKKNLETLVQAFSQSLKDERKRRGD